MTAPLAKKKIIALFAEVWQLCLARLLPTLALSFSTRMETFASI